MSKSTYAYDGLDRLRIITRYTWDTGASEWTQQSQKKFVYDGMQAIQERDGDDNVTATNIWDGNIGGLEARVVYDVETPANPPQKYFYHYDGSGNVTAVTDETQQTVAQYEYDAYGNLINSNGAYALQNPWRFSTKYFDDGSGLYYYGYRFYSPGLGKWINRDPIAESGGLNLYGFVGNGPVNSGDGYGLSEDIGGSNNTIRLSFSAFIPKKSVAAPDGHSYKGDGREYSGNSPSYRIEQNIRVDLKTGRVSISPILTGWTVQDGVRRKQTVPTMVAATSSRTASGGYSIHVSGYASDPFFETVPFTDIPLQKVFPYKSWAPSIMWDLTITLDKCGHVKDVKGMLKQFPAYELWAYRNGQPPSQIFGYNPYKHGKGLSDLYRRQYLK